jgi:hypothetical protein
LERAGRPELLGRRDQLAVPGGGQQHGVGRVNHRHGYTVAG